MVLRLIQTAKTTVPLEVEGILPETLGGKPRDEIEKTEIFHGNTRIPLAEFFAVAGDPSDEHVVWEGDLSGVHWIGCGMSRGRVDVLGNAGRHLGSEMTGGAIHVEGDAGDWVGGEMHGGLICVRGRAGHLVGAAYRGSARGMTGGTILVRGPAGNEIGHTMRRGLIAVGGAADMVGFNMLAGTVMVFGDAGIRHGAGMRRGTLVFFGQRPTILPSYRHGCRFAPPILPLLLRELRTRGYAAADGAETTFDLFHGDLLNGGRGELFVR